MPRLVAVTCRYPSNTPGWPPLSSRAENGTYQVDVQGHVHIQLSVRVSYVPCTRTPFGWQCTTHSLADPDRICLYVFDLRERVRSALPLNSSLRNVSSTERKDRQPLQMVHNSIITSAQSNHFSITSVDCDWIICEASDKMEIHS